MDSDSDTDDEETQIQELQQLAAVIEADDALMSEYSHSLYKSSVGSNSSARHSLAKIEDALSLNKLTEEKLVRLEKVMMNRLRECQSRLQDFKCSTSTEKQDGQKKFRYVHCGRPYFRDRQNFPAPDNLDAIVVKQARLYEKSIVSSVAGWTVNDKCQFMAAILQMSKAIRTKELESEIAQLLRDAKIAKAENLDEQLRALRKEIQAIKKKGIEELALPLDREYDWDAIAMKLKRRHNAQEYQALWKLYLHPSINKGTWSKEEHAKIQRIVSNNNMQDWEKIARELGTGRTGYQCFVYHRTNTNNSVTQKWTKEEEEYLKRLIDFYREDDYIPWGKVASSMGNRTKIQIYNKYSSINVKRKGRFLREEDAVILTCIQKYGKNFAKIANFLPGRSIKQIHVRYNILVSQRRHSVVWTPEEDKKLVKIVSNSDHMVNYSKIVNFFPGKDRFNIRARYTTLERWMKRHPYEDISQAPRRAARRLSHGQSTSDIDVAVESLKSRMQTEVENRKSTRISINSTKEEILDSIAVIAANEYAGEEALKKQADEDLEDNKQNMWKESLDESTLHRVLIMLRASLSKDFFDLSKYKDMYPGLPSCSLRKNGLLRSYSKTPRPGAKSPPDIWGNPLTHAEHFLPPNYDTITGCRKIMKHVRDMMHKLDAEKPCFSMVEKNNVLVKEQKQLLMERFSTLFLWPMLLSNVLPSPAREKIAGVPKSRNTKMPTMHTHQFVKPHIKELDEVNESINLEDPSPKRQIVITGVYVGNDDFMYLPVEDRADQMSDDD